MSGPARQPARALERSVDAERGLALGLLAGLNSLWRNPSLDRLIRGRTWIALIAFALIGIVTLQLLVLKLNANIGRALVREGQLQRENAALSIESSELASGERVEAQAARLGMQLVPDGALRFLSNDPHADIARAASALSAPAHTSSSASGTEASTTPSAQTSTEPTEASTTTRTQTSSEPAEGSAEASGESAATPASASETAPAGEQSATASATGAAEATPLSGAG